MILLVSEDLAILCWDTLPSRRVSLGVMDGQACLEICNVLRTARTNRHLHPPTEVALLLRNSKQPSLASMKSVIRCSFLAPLLSVRNMRM